MSLADDFKDFLANVAINNADIISERYGEVTRSLNKEFRDTESRTANSLQVGSYGRWTAIRGISDLDMIYIMPQSKWETYDKDGGQSKLLKDTKEAIKKRYPSTTVKVDGLVVRVLYSNFDIEVQPAFKQDDGSFKYPHTAKGGSWKITKPQAEIDEMKAANERKNRNLRRLCKMGRAWKNKHGVVMGGLLMDTLAYNFLESTSDYDTKSFAAYGTMCRDFFAFLADEPEKDYYAALGSQQQVRVKKKFQTKAKRGRELCDKAIDASGQKNERQKWRDVFGNGFPAPSKSSQATSDHAARSTEEFIEDRYAIDIRYSMALDCDITQNGFRQMRLRQLLKLRIPIFRKKTLMFSIVESDFPSDCVVYWKVLNRGDEAVRRDCIRGQIVPDFGKRTKKERSEFMGDHLVECYAVRRGVVVARAAILVPITTKTDDLCPA